MSLTKRTVSDGKYIVYEENSLKQVSIELDTPLEARLRAENHNNSPKRWDYKNIRYKWTTLKEFKNKLLQAKKKEILMKALINLDREATLEILKLLNVDIKPEIVDNYKKLVQREIELYCQNQLYDALNKYTNDTYFYIEKLEKKLKIANELINLILSFKKVEKYEHIRSFAEHAKEQMKDIQ